MTLPVLKLSPRDRLFLAVELDIAAETYEDCIHLGNGTIDAEAKRTAKRLRALAVRMRGAPAPEIEGEPTRLDDIRFSRMERDGEAYIGDGPYGA